MLLLTLTLTLALLLTQLPAREPTVLQTATLKVDDVERALQLARQHDPRHAIPGVVRTLRLTQREAELLINHAAARWRPSRWALRVDAGQLQLDGSIQLPNNPLGRWLNLSLRAHPTRGLPQLERVTLGPVSLPLPLVNWAFNRFTAAYGLEDARALTLVAVQTLRLRPQRLELVYAWGPDAPARMLTLLLPAQERQRLQVYAAQLAQVTATLPAQALSLSQLLPPMFELARRRSADGHDAASENRAALLVLGMVANGVGLGTLLPERAAELAARPIRLTLAGRHDSPQHFLVSATLAAGNGSPLADMIGLFKELSDARSGSGFSFNDMAANRAGTRLGVLAVGSPERLQQLLTTGLQEQDLLPDVSDLPEGMNETEFRRRFGAPGSPAYERLMSDIEGRLGSTSLGR
ncbi:MAG: hypothetical protein IPL57_09965 [Rubrivivax sp.]|nr:hypothetical protein [Rubrivivax sp.]